MTPVDLYGVVAWLVVGLVVMHLLLRRRSAMTATAAASLHEIAERAHLDWTIHWSACRTRRKDDGYCKCCDQLDLAANAAESAERKAAR